MRTRFHAIFGERGDVGNMRIALITRIPFIAVHANPANRRLRPPGYGEFQGPLAISLGSICVLKTGLGRNFRDLLPHVPNGRHEP